MSPGTNRNAITVGAVDDKRTADTSDDTIATFSSRGPTPDGVNKPDLVAPGVNISSLSNNKLDSYVPLSGTSMATPLVSGTIALLFNEYGNLNPLQVKTMLMNSCIDLNDTATHQGAGMLNLKMLFSNKEKIDFKTDEVKEYRKVKDYNKSQTTQKVKNEVAAASKSSDNDFFETAIMILVIMFLLDSRI